MSVSQFTIQNSILPVRKVQMQTQIEPSKVNPDGFTNQTKPVSKIGENGHGVNPNTSKKISSKIVPTGIF